MGVGANDGLVEKAASSDGTRIAFHRSGSGPALVLVHGTAADHMRWRPVLPAFEKHFSVCAVDRRGRGASSDSDEYAIEREYEDVAAVIASLEPPVCVFGHSYGGICCLGAARAGAAIERLVLYEPPVAAAGWVSRDLIERLEAEIARGRPEAALILFNTEVLRMSAEQIQSLRALPAWQGRVAAAHTIPRELRAVDQMTFTPRDYHGITVPTLLLGGGDSPGFLKASNELVYEAVPHASVVVMAGQQHVAMDTATDQLTATVLEFLLA